MERIGLHMLQTCTWSRKHASSRQHAFVTAIFKAVQRGLTQQPNEAFRVQAGTGTTEVRRR